MSGTNDLRFGVALQGVDPPGEFSQLARDIEEWGFDQLWLTDSSLHARYVYAYLALAATATSRLMVGTSVTNPVTRHPAMNALAIATIDEISGGRAAFGIGPGDRPLKSLGLRPARLAALRDAVETTRCLLRGETVSHNGESFCLDGAHMRFPAGRDIPIYLSASGPRSLETAGEIGDGVIVLAGLFPEGIQYALSHIRVGARRSGREDSDVAVFMYGSVRPDEYQAVKEARSIAAWFCQTAPHYCRLAGMSEELCEQVRSAYGGGEFQEATRAAELVPDALVQKTALAGTPEQARAKVEMLAGEGVRNMVLFPLGPDRRAVIELFARDVLPAFRKQVKSRR